MARAQVKDYQADRREIVLGTDGEDDPLKVVYRPSRRTPEFAGRYNEILKQNDSHKLWVFTVCSLVIEWNLTGPLVIEQPKRNSKGKIVTDDYGVPTYEEKEIVPAGQPVPITSDVLRYMETEELAKIVQAIADDMSPDPKSETTS